MRVPVIHEYTEQQHSLPKDPDPWNEERENRFHHYPAEGGDILTTCAVCRGVRNHLPVPLSHLEDGLRKGCGLCQLLRQGIKKLSDDGTEETRIAFRRLEYVHFGKSNVVDGHFKFLLSEGPDRRGRALRFEAFRDRHRTPLSPVLQCYLPQDVPTRLDIDRVVALIQRWGRSCDEHHTRCQVLPNSPLPKRILQISSRENQPVKLVQLSGVRAPYIALSYCWGVTKSPLITTSTTLAENLRGIPTSSFPRLFQDAISICKALNIRYLWLDALCIVQDSTEDWELESAKMADIYSNSYLTIAASSCRDTTESLFSNRWTSTNLPGGNSYCKETGAIAVDAGSHIFHVRPELHLAHDRFSLLDNAHLHHRDAPLLSRAWGFQERLLAPRTLHFHAEELVWECKADVRCECGAIDDRKLRYKEYDKGNFPLAYTGYGWLKRDVASAEEQHRDNTRLPYVWMDLVSEFSCLNLTYESDRLPALSGLAANFTNNSLGEYLAGIWTNMLPLALLYDSKWSQEDFEHPQSYHPQAPSWSWASIPLSARNSISYDLALKYYNNSPAPEFKVVRVSGKVLGKNPFGWVKWGLLTVRGLATKCFVLENEHGGLALRRRGSRVLRSSQEDLIDVHMDHPTSGDVEAVCVLLWVGGCFGLVLQDVIDDPNEARRHRRIGLARSRIPWSAWELHWQRYLEVRQFDIV